MNAKFAKSKQQTRVIRMKLKPSLSTLNLPDCIGFQTFRIQPGQFGIPLSIQTLLDNLMSGYTVAYRRTRTGRGSGLFAVLLIHRRYRLPVFFQCVRIQYPAFEILDMGAAS